MRLAIAGELASTLGHEGIACAPFKGVALVCREYADPGLRPMDDIDVLVPREAFARALALLGGCGWAVTSPVRRVGSGSYQVRMVGRGGAVVELHHAFEAPELFPLDYEGILGRCAPAQVSPGLLLMSPEDSLLGLAVHHAKHAWILQARDILDTALVARGVRDWAEVWSRARQWNLEVALSLSLNLARRLDETIPSPRRHSFPRILPGVLSRDPPFNPFYRLPRAAHVAAMFATAGPRRFAVFGARFVADRLLRG